MTQAEAWRGDGDFDPILDFVERWVCSVCGMLRAWQPSTLCVVRALAPPTKDSTSLSETVLIVECDHEFRLGPWTLWMQIEGI